MHIKLICKIKAKMLTKYVTTQFLMCYMNYQFIVREKFKKNRNYSLITTKNKIIVILSFKIVFLLIKRSLRHKLKNRNYFYLLM